MKKGKNNAKVEHESKMEIESEERELRKSLLKVKIAGMERKTELL